MIKSRSNSAKARNAALGLRHEVIGPRRLGAFEQRNVNAFVDINEPMLARRQHAGDSL